MSQLSYPRSDSDANGPRFATPYVLPGHPSWDHDQASLTPKPKPVLTPKLIQFNSLHFGEESSSLGVKTDDPSSLGVKTDDPLPEDDWSGYVDNCDLLDRDPISDVIAGCIPGDGEDIGRCIFDLARGVAGVRPDAYERELREYVARWIAACRKAGIQVSGFSDAWAVFKRKWPTIKVPSGSRWQAVIDRAQTVAVPVGIGPKLAPIFRLFAAMDEIASDDDGLVFVSYRDLGNATGLDHKTASRYVAKLAAIGYIELVQSGDFIRKRNGRANRYRLHNPPLPGGAPWNSGATSGPAPQKPTEARQKPAREAPRVERSNLPDKTPKPAKAVLVWSDPDAPPLELFDPPGRRCGLNAPTISSVVGRCGKPV